MRLRARPFVHYAPVPGGVYLSSTRSQFVLRGPDALFVIIDTCIPMLEDGTTEDDLVTALGTERSRPAVRTLVQTLRSCDLLLPLQALAVSEPEPDVRATYPETLAHLEANSDDPYAHFEQLRAATVVLYGPAQVILPAARGLARAGVHRLLLACPDSRATRGVAERLDATLLPTHGAALTDALAAADAVLWCADAASWALDLPFAAPVVPIALGDDILVVGPVLRRSGDLESWRAFLLRARSWAHGEPVARPGGDALAGAIASQRAYELLTCTLPDEVASIVAGAELDVEPVTVAFTGRQADADRPRPLVEQLALLSGGDVRPELDDLVRAADRVTARWCGVLSAATPPELQQLPLALRVLTYPSGADTVVGWGWDQPTATVAAALEGLRRGAQPGAAAGVTPLRWLLDGALRLLAPAATAVEAAAAVEITARTVQVRQALAATGAAADMTQLLRVDGLTWVLARVVDVDGAASLAWAPNPAAAIEGASARLLACRQVRDFMGADLVGASIGTEALLTEDDEVVAALARQVAALIGDGRLAGSARPALPDAVLGALPLHSGEVLDGTRRTGDR